MTPKSLRSAGQFNTFGKGYLPELLGIEILDCEPDRVIGRLPIGRSVLAPNGFLHAASIVALADTLAGYATLLNLPEGAEGFTTLELKTNHMGTALKGAIRCEATPLHRGRSTQVWDSIVSHEGSNKTIALYRCTQMILWPR